MYNLGQMTGIYAFKMRRKRKKKEKAKALTYTTAAFGRSRLGVNVTVGRE